MKRRALGFGAGGHAEVIVEILQMTQECEVVALLDADPARHGAELRGVPVRGGDEKLAELIAAGVTHAFVALAGFGDATLRRRLFERGCDAGLQFLCVIHPRATISPSASLGAGTVVFANATVNTGAQIGRNVIINTGAIIDHHCRIGDHVHIAPGACLAGRIDVGDGAQIGLGARIFDGVRIGRDAVIGAGAVVLKDVPDATLAIGVPATYFPR